MNVNNARIAKNTLFLYFRHILILLVSLYTVRVTLQILGVEDYGIFNVVAGFVFLFFFLNDAMTSSTLRFLNFAIGSNNIEQVRDVYSASIIIHAFLALVFVILAETIGLWFFHKMLNIPAERREVALIVYQFSIISMILSIIRVPYNSIVIAYEKMSFFAMLSIIECILKLLVVLLLKFIVFDKLAVYSFFIFLLGLIVFLVNKIYCNKMFETAHYRHCKDKNIFNKIIAFSGWNFIGSFSSISSSHGTNILINIFYGVTVNAAMAIANQVRNAVYQFINNFQTAYKPQLISLYAAKEYAAHVKLLFQASKFSYFLLFIFILPLYINLEFVLQLWLDIVPEYSIIFTKLLLLISLETSISGPFLTSVQATGNIKKYQLIVSFLTFLNLPLSFVLLFLGFSSIWVLIVKFILTFITSVWSLFFLSKNSNFPISSFLQNVLIPIIIISVASCLVTLFSSQFFANWLKLFFTCTVSTLCIILTVYFVGLSIQERNTLKAWISSKRSKLWAKSK